MELRAPVAREAAHGGEHWRMGTAASEPFEGNADFLVKPEPESDLNPTR